MPAESDPKPSFTPYRKWGIALNVGFVLLVVLAVVCMLNYVSRDYFVRLRVGSSTKMPLSPRTLKFLDSMTNHVKVTVYYDRDEPFFSTIMDLLSEYRMRNSRITVQVVDYKRDPGGAQQLRSKYTFLSGPNAKNLVIFDAEHGGVKSLDGNTLTKYVYEQLPNAKEREYRLKPLTFEGERAFTATLLAVTSPSPLKAFFLRGHGEHEIQSEDENLGYRRFVSVLNENYIQADYISLLGTNTLSPTNCNLLVIAGPTLAFLPEELEKIDQYLAQGGRMLALFNFMALRNGETGLEKVLAGWGVDVSTNIVDDPGATTVHTDVIVSSFNPNHPVVNPLLGSSLQLIMPRAVGKLRGGKQPVNGPQVEELAYSTPQSFFKGTPSEHHPCSLMVAVEKGSIKGVPTERGTTRIVAVGDSFFLANRQIQSAANRDFLGYAVNWLVDRPQFLEGVGPRPVQEYRLLMTTTQLNAAQWLLLGAMPGGMLLVGGVVWFRRRR